MDLWCTLFGVIVDLWCTLIGVIVDLWCTLIGVFVDLWCTLIGVFVDLSGQRGSCQYTVDDEGCIRPPSSGSYLSRIGSNSEPTGKYS